MECGVGVCGNIYLSPVGNDDEGGEGGGGRGKGEGEGGRCQMVFSG